MIFMSKLKTKRDFLTIIEHPGLNWENKARLVQEIFSEEGDTKEIYLALILKSKKPRIRKGAAAILSYLPENPFLPELCSQLFKEPDWSVRYAIAQSLRAHSGVEIIDQIKNSYNASIKEVGSQERDRMEIVLAEVLGLIGRKEAIPILIALLDELYSYREQIPLEVVLQTLFALGELGDQSTVKLLLKFSAENERNPKAIRDSANHAITKIAKRLGFATKKDLLQVMQQELP